MVSRSLFIIIFFLSSVRTKAQPVVAATDFNPVAGDVIIDHELSSIPLPGASGPNAFWDFSGYTASSGTTLSFTWHGCEPATNCGAYPGANTVEENNDFPSSPYGYFTTTSDKLTQVNAYTLSGASIPYDDEADIMRYPMTYQDSFTDFNAVAYTESGNQYNHSGSITKVADAYGTLITPAGTYNNALRLHTIEPSFTYDAQGAVISGTQFEGYLWLVPGIHAAAYAIYKQTNIANGDTTFQQGARYVVQFPAAVTVTTLTENGFKVYPNPATTTVYVDFSTNVTANVSVTLTDVTGRLVAILANGTVKAGRQHYSYPTTGLPRGLYYLHLKSGTIDMMQKVEVL